VPMASILPFIKKETVFDDAATRVMGDAFDAVCKSLRDKGQPEIVYEVIARRIMKPPKRASATRNVCALPEPLDSKRARQAALSLVSSVCPFPCKSF
jgi:hypothetical protein